MKIELRPVAKIKPYERNPRQNDDAVDAVARSIQEFGFRQPIVIDEHGEIVVGHTRWKAAKQLGMAQVPVHVAGDLTEEQKRAYRLADNKTAEIAAWDKDLLAIELSALEDLDVDLNSLGFTDDDLSALLGGGIKDGECDPDDVPEPPDEAITQPGDLWILRSASGIEHRLLCGDSALAPDVDRLIAVDPAQAPDLPADSDIRVKLPPIHLVNTDPPYNVKVEPRSNNAIAGGLSSFPKGNGIHKGRGNLKHHQSFDVARQGPKKATHKKLVSV